MGSGSVLLKGHRHRPLGIAGLSGGQRMMAALARVQGKGLQRQTAQEQQGRSGERQGQGSPVAVDQAITSNVNQRWMKHSPLVDRLSLK